MVDREPRHQSPAWVRLATLAAFLVLSLFAGAAAGFLIWAGGGNVPSAVVAGGASFGATLLLLLAIAAFITNRD